MQEAGHLPLVGFYEPVGLRVRRAGRRRVGNALGSEHHAVVLRKGAVADVRALRPGFDEELHLLRLLGHDGGGCGRGGLRSHVVRRQDRAVLDHRSILEILGPVADLDGLREQARRRA